MSNWIRNLIPLGLVLGLALSAAAEPLSYPIQRLDNSVNVGVTGVAQVTYTPLIGPPLGATVSGFSVLNGRATGSGVADVGLPSAFAGGANGILLSAFQANTSFDESATLFTDVFDQLPPIPTPIPLGIAIVFVDIADLSVTLEEPLSSALEPTNPNEFSWEGEAPVTIEGTVNLVLMIPTQEPIGLPSPVPFSISSDALFGAFSGDATTTTLDVGFDEVDIDTTGTMSLHVNLGLAGSLSVDLTSLRLMVDASYTGLNRKYGLPPSGGGVPGCGIGPELALLLPPLGWLSRRRRRAA